MRVVIENFNVHTSHNMSSGVDALDEFPPEMTENKEIFFFCQSNLQRI